MEVINLLRKLLAELQTTDSCLVSVQVGNHQNLQPISGGETRIIVVDEMFQSVTVTDDEWKDVDKLADEIISLMREQRESA